MIREWHQDRVVCFKKDITATKVINPEIVLGLSPSEDVLCTLEINDGRRR
jgi:hypothetical protein